MMSYVQRFVSCCFRVFFLLVASLSSHIVYADQHTPNSSGFGTQIPNSSAPNSVLPNSSGAGQPFQGSTQLRNPLDPSISSIPAFFNAILEILIVFAIPFVVFFIILAGYHYVMARGNTSEIQKAHQALLYAIIGGLIILGAQAILVLITGTVREFAPMP